MTDEENLKQKIKELKSQFPKMGMCEMWYYNFDYYQIRYKEFEKIFNSVEKKYLTKKTKK